MGGGSLLGLGWKSLHSLGFEKTDSVVSLDRLWRRVRTTKARWIGRVQMSEVL